MKQLCQFAFLPGSFAFVQKEMGRGGEPAVFFAFLSAFGHNVGIRRVVQRRVIKGDYAFEGTELQPVFIQQPLRLAVVAHRHPDGEAQLFVVKVMQVFGAKKTSVQGEGIGRQSELGDGLRGVYQGSDISDASMYKPVEQRQMRLSRIDHIQVDLRQVFAITIVSPFGQAELFRVTGDGRGVTDQSFRVATGLEPGTEKVVTQVRMLAEVLKQPSHRRRRQRQVCVAQRRVVSPVFKTAERAPFAALKNGRGQNALSVLFAKGAYQGAMQAAVAGKSRKQRDAAQFNVVTGCQGLEHDLPFAKQALAPGMDDLAPAVADPLGLQQGDKLRRGLGAAPAQ